MRRARPAAGVLRVLALVAWALALASVALAAPKKPKSVDQVWTRPDFASFGVTGIAMLPVSTFDSSAEAELMVAQAVGATFNTSGHRWLSAPTVREVVRGDPAGEELLKSARAGLLKSPRVDSLLAPQLCARLRVNGLLAVRVDLWERRQMEWNEAGRPSTTVRVSAALVDSLGHLLWTATGNETGEGPYHDPSAGVLGVSGTALGLQPLTNQGGAPSFAEVLTRLFTRLATEFPSRAAPAPASAAPQTP